MSKKRAKSGTGSAGACRWESGLLTTPFEEECWTSFVGFIVPSEFPDQEYANSFCSSIKVGHRKLFSLVTYKGLIEEVQELGNPKGKKPKEVPAFSEICEAVKVHLDSGEAIPLPLFAKLVKWKLLAIKHEDLKRRETDVNNTNGRDKDKKSGMKSARGKSAKGKGKKTPEVPSPKKESTLKKRGEESQENKYIDDEPDDGPQHYILLYGFLEASLLVLLNDLGINIGCVLRLSSEDYGLFEKRKALKEEEEDIPKPQEVIDAEREAEDKATKEIERFWSQYEPLLKRAPEDSSLHDVARLTYTVKSDVVPQEYDDPNNQAEFGEALFEDVACMIYDLLDQRRQYQNYKDNMKLIRINASHIPAEARPTSSSIAPGAAASTTLVQPDAGQQSPNSPADVDMRYYRDLMNTVPAECCSVPLIMHCMLEQVVATEEGRDPPSVQLEHPRDDGLAHALAAHIDSISAKFISGPKTKDENANSKIDQFPVFYHHGDKTSEHLRYLSDIGSFDHVAAEQSMMKLLPVSMVTKFPRPTTGVIKERSARLHELLYQCFQEGMDPAVMDHTLRKFVFESMALRSSDEEGRVQRDRPDEEVVWDDPYLNVKRREEASHDDNTNEPGGATLPVGAPRPPSALDISRSQTPGILKSRQGSATSVRSSKSQVHFKDGLEADRIKVEPRRDDSRVSIPGKRPSPTPSLISVRDVADTPQRKLDEWCFVEHLKPNVLLQILDEARTLRPFIDTYYHRKDHSLLIVMHNPAGPERKNMVCWDAKLHSDVGFRNYLEHVAGYISDWTEKEEEKYLVEMGEQEIAAELAAAKLAASETSSPSGSRPGSGKGRAQSPKKSRSKSPKGRKSESPAPASNLDPNSSSFMRPNSLKAWKVEHDMEVAEEERKKQEKDKKAGRKKSARSQSASPTKEEKEDKGKSDGKKRSSSGSGRGSRKGEKEKKEEGENKDEVEAEKLTEPERYYPFVGYDVGNNMIHVNGSLTSLFPTEGGLICCEKTEFINGDVSIQATVLRDSHALTVHIINPSDVPEGGDESGQLMNTDSAPNEQDQKPAEPAESPLSRFGSLTATLSDGMVLSFSSYGIHGAPTIKEQEVKEEVEQPLLVPPSPPPAPVSPKSGRGGSGKKGKKGAPAASIAESEKPSQRGSDSNKEQGEGNPSQQAAHDNPEEPQYQQLFISCPTGLHVTYTLEPESGSEEGEKNHPKLLVKQSYPSKTAGRQPSEAAILDPAMKERCRYINSDGVVIKLMEDCTTEVLFPTGVVSRGAVSSPVEGGTLPEQSLQRAGSSASTHPGNMKVPDGEAGEPATNDPGLCQMEWVITTVTGDQVSTRSGDSPLREKAVLLYSATDPVTPEVMTTRQDKVVIVERPDGTRIVDHSDGTRMTSYTVDVEYREAHGDAEETGEHAPLKVRSVQQVKVECVGYATVIFNSEDSIATTVFGNGSQVIAIPNGSYEVLHHDGARITVAKDGCVQFTPAQREGDGGTPSPSAVYTLHHHKKVICEVTEKGGARFSVNWKGEVDSDLPPDQTKEESGKEAVEGDDGYGKEKELTNMPRYFVVHADGSGSELLREVDVVNYFRRMELDPSTAFISDPLPDHPDIQGITVMRPYQPRDHSENWMIKLDESNIVPANLRPRDFANLPTSELMRPGNKLGAGAGRGLAVGSCEKLLEPPPAPRCPQYLQLRQFTQYKQMDAAVRQDLEAALESYARKMEEQEKVDAERELKDPRSEEEKVLAGELLAQILAQDEDQQKDSSSGVSGTDGERSTQMADASAPVPAQPLSVEDPAISRDLYETSTAPEPVTPPPKPQNKYTAQDWERASVEDPAISRDLYEISTALEPVTPPPKPQNKYTARDWERARAALDEEGANREVLRRHEVPRYFDSQWGKSFLATQTADKLDEPDMEELAKRLAQGTIKGTQPPSSCPPDTPEGTSSLGGRDSEIRQSQDIERLSDPTTNVLLLQTPGDGRSPAIQGAASSPSDVRPTNPTPGHAIGDRTPTQVRPTAPTPGHATQTEPFHRPGNPIAKGTDSRNRPSTTPSSYASFPNHPSTIPEQPEEINAMGGNNGGFQDNHFSDEALPVTFSSESVIEGSAQEGEDSASPAKPPSSRARRTPVKLPAAIQGQKPPGTLPNRQFQQVEEPVRRKVTTSSLAGSSGETKVSANRGFELFPGEVFFGELREGCTYSMVVNLKNVGIDTCRYKVKQPPPATGLQVIYKPGPVAAGMKAELKIQLYAIAVGVEGDSGRGSIGHHIEITTETDFLFLPVSAYILTADRYDEECRVNGRPYLSPGARLISNRPPSREGIIRPRKDVVNPVNGGMPVAQV